MIVGTFSQNGDTSQSILIFGLGLVGKALLGRLQRSPGFSCFYLPYSWTCDATRAADSKKIFRHVRDLIVGSSSIKRIDFVWAAGKSGFAGRKVDFQTELDSFADVLELMDAMADLDFDGNRVFHCVSSGGGLFEGQTHVDQFSTPDPLRPYGETKLKEEQLLEELLTDKAFKMVYRASSIYGPISPGDRVGLISAIIINAYQAKVTRIYGKPDTIRDFVLVQDVAAFIRDKLVEDTLLSSNYLLASGKPTSMNEVIGLAGALVQPPIYFEYRRDVQNTLDNSYKPSALPLGWTPSDLSTGIKQTITWMLGTR